MNANERLDSAIEAAKTHRKRFERTIYGWLLAITVGVTVALAVGVTASSRAESVGVSTCQTQRDTISYLRQRAKKLHHPGFDLPEPNCGDHK